MRVWLVAIAAIVVGIVAWEAVVPPGTRKEAWDLPIYWQAAYPVMVAGSLLFGWFAPERPWRWGLLICMGQGVWVLVTTALRSGVPNLLPLGLVMFAILSLPCMIAAYAGAALSRKRGG